jgi:hypothetical protein
VARLRCAEKHAGRDRKKLNREIDAAIADPCMKAKWQADRKRNGEVGQGGARWRHQAGLNARPATSNVLLISSRSTAGSPRGSAGMASLATQKLMNN